VMAIVIPPMYTHSSYWLWAAGLWELLNVNVVHVPLVILIFWTLYLKKEKVMTYCLGRTKHGICKVVSSSIALRLSAVGVIFLFPWSYINQWEDNSFIFYSNIVIWIYVDTISCPLKTLLSGFL
jgi:hypothetical protein